MSAFVVGANAGSSASASVPVERDRLRARLARVQQGQVVALEPRSDEVRAVGLHVASSWPCVEDDTFTVGLPVAPVTTCTAVAVLYGEVGESRRRRAPATFVPAWHLRACRRRGADQARAAWRRDVRRSRAPSPNCESCAAAAVGAPVSWGSSLAAPSPRRPLPPPPPRLPPPGRGLGGSFGRRFRTPPPACRSARLRWRRGSARRSCSVGSTGCGRSPPSASPAVRSAPVAVRASGRSPRARCPLPCPSATSIDTSEPFFTCCRPRGLFEDRPRRHFRLTTCPPAGRASAPLRRPAFAARHARRLLPLGTVVCSVAAAGARRPPPPRAAPRPNSHHGSHARWHRPSAGGRRLLGPGGVAVASMRRRAAPDPPLARRKDREGRLDPLPRLHRDRRLGEAEEAFPRRRPRPPAARRSARLRRSTR